jgi:intracellular multiplication protein IcmD
VGKSKKSIKFLKRMSLCTTAVSAGLLHAGVATAAGAQSLGGVASTITSSFASITKLITGGSYIAGIGFAVSAIMKFKQHKDNPTQIPIGTPIALLFIAAALLFLPSVLGVAGQTLFGGGTVAGPSGSVFSV